jgi:hypothetical protein
MEESELIKNTVASGGEIYKLGILFVEETEKFQAELLPLMNSLAEKPEDLERIKDSYPELVVIQNKMDQLNKRLQEILMR